jgi:GxxExxY protein
MNEKTYKILGACFTVANTLGHGFLENVYQEALAIEFNATGIPYEKEKSIDIHYKDQKLKCSYIADFICYDSIIVELKAIQSIANTEKAQVINYLNACKFKVGLLINFGSPKIQYERIVLNL